MQIGSCIIGARELFPDNPATQVSPPSESAFTVTQTTGGSLLGGTYYLVFTYLNNAGETSGSAEGSITLTGGNTAISVQPPAFPAGVTTLRIYLGQSMGGESQFFSTTTASGPTTITSLPGSPGTPPINNTAFNPDSDGAVVGASTVYRWMNDALSKCSLAAGGINDVTGLGTTQAYGMYTLMNRWVKFTNAWYDGWIMSFLDNGNFYYHNSSTGISWMLSMQKATTNNTLEVWPQPMRTSGQSTVATTAVRATANTITLNSVAGWVLPLGLALLGTPSNGEIISYSVLGATQLQGCLRVGFGGTVPQAWPIGTPVTELNIRMKGRRMPVYYGPGSSLVTLDIPYDWEEHIKDYMVGMYREAEQEFQEARSKKNDFLAWTKDLARQNRQLAGPVQVGLASREIWGSSIGGGWFIP